MAGGLELVGLLEVIEERMLGRKKRYNICHLSPEHNYFSA